MGKVYGSDKVRIRLVRVRVRARLVRLRVIVRVSARVRLMG
jgi:hypothetical protein